MSNESRLSVWRFVDGIIDKSYGKTNFIDEFSEEEWEKYRQELLPLDKIYKVIERKKDLIVLSHGYSAVELTIELSLIDNCISELYIGKKLSEEVNKIKGLKERYSISTLKKYIDNPVKDDEVCALYGLRRTGKSYMMLQSIKYLLDKGEKVAYFLLNDKVDIKNLKRSVEKLIEAEYKYIYFDEITSVTDLLHNAITFTDGYAGRGIHIILSGTDSYILRLFESEALGRVIRINTTFISYKEYCHLKGSQVNYIKDYLYNGGIFEIDKCYISSHGDKDRKNKFKDKEDYVKNAITDNIRHSILAATSKNIDSTLFNLAKNEEKFNTAVEKTVALENRKFLLSVITSEKEIGSFVSIIRNFDTDIDEDYLIKQFNEKLSINNFINDYTEEEVSKLKNYLIRLNVLTEYASYEGKNEETCYLYTQPGLRYRQLQTMLDLLKEDSSFLNINTKMKNDIIEHISDRVEGPLIEHNIICHLLYKYKDNPNIQITQYHLTEGGEFDLVLGDKKASNLMIFEIKRGDNNSIKKKWYRWLLNESNICDKIIDDLKYLKVIDKYLLFNGTTDLNKLIKDDNDEDVNIKHLNMEEFLLNIKDFIKF